MNQTKSKRSSGIISWMIANRVTPNLLMIVLIVGGYLMSSQIKREVFPEFELDRISIKVGYTGASPEEVEQGIILAIEESISSVNGIKEISATAQESFGIVQIYVRDDASPQQVFQDVKQQIDRITTFPIEAEEPTVRLDILKHRVLRINLFGEVGEHILTQTAEQTRDRLIQSEEISQVEIRGKRDYEITISVPAKNLRKYNLTLDQIATKIRQSSSEIPGGKLETSGGEVLLRVKDRKTWADDFSTIPIITSLNGTYIRLADIGSINESFEDTTSITTLNNQPSIQLYVYRVGKQSPISVSTAVKQVMEEAATSLPPGVDWIISSDRSKVYEQRLSLLLKNAFIGLTLVLILLGVFLELKLAFWVTLGIPISFLGALLFLPLFDVSINVISMFAFIIALGIVVDDAIIAGENIYQHREKGMNFVDAALEGAKDVAVPISFSILTNIVAFLPLAFVPGVMGKVWRVIPFVVITIFLISWIESLLILPTHLGHSRKGSRFFLAKHVRTVQKKFSRLLKKFITQVYTPSLQLLLQVRFLVIGCLVGMLVITIGYVKSGRISMILAPRIESNRAVATAILPIGSPVSEMIRVRDKLTQGLEKVAESNGHDQLIEAISASINSNVIVINGFLTPPDIRPINTGEVTKQWRKACGPIVGLQSLRYEADRGGPGSGAAISIELSHKELSVLDNASKYLAEKLLEYPFIKDIDDGYTPGKTQLNFEVNAWGQSLGFTPQEIGKQIRHHFQGVIALRQQRDNNEVTVRVRLPKNERSYEHTIENLLLATKENTFVPLSHIATLNRGRAFTDIQRTDGRRAVVVSANVSPIGKAAIIREDLNNVILPELKNTFPRLTYQYKGRQADRKEGTDKLFQGFIFALGGIYFLLAIPLRSYLQPLVIMLAIPFGMIGSVLGHLIMGYDLSLMSMMGIVALSGVVVNDSLILVDYANKQRTSGKPSFEAIKEAGARRFRPVLLTTLTTFGGLSPMIWETSRQAKFLIPMAISLGFGIVFATVITLILTPCLYLVLEDIRRIQELVGKTLYTSDKPES